MNTIGVVGAMKEEIAYLKSKLELVAGKNIVGADFFMGKLHGKNIVLVHSGIGKVNAAISTQALIDMYGVDCVINIGVAGAIDKALNIGDIVISKDSLYHDFDVTSFGYKLSVIPRLDVESFFADEDLISISEKACQTVLKNNAYYIGRISSGDIFVASSEYKDKISHNFKSLCVEMEGAAIAHTCHLNKVPFVIIRSISDKANQEAKETYASSLEKAIENSNLVSEEIIKNLRVY